MEKFGILRWSLTRSGRNRRFALLLKADAKMSKMTPIPDNGVYGTKAVTYITPTLLIVKVKVKSDHRSNCF